ncbi:MAG TPA: hypothetical protein VKT78_09320 [Fimbriimonadaceae bacterium]|nr:hypothetical protein [Fimbriimonadaceae bacterium]
MTYPKTFEYGRDRVVRRLVLLASTLAVAVAIVLLVHAAFRISFNEAAPILGVLVLIAAVGVGTTVIDMLRFRVVIDKDEVAWKSRTGEPIRCPNGQLQVRQIASAGVTWWVLSDGLGNQTKFSRALPGHEELAAELTARSPAPMRGV